eukprot:2349126-Rhodomonas_salina.1
MKLRHGSEWAPPPAVAHCKRETFWNARKTFVSSLHGQDRRLAKQRPHKLAMNSNRTCQKKPLLKPPHAHQTNPQAAQTARVSASDNSTTGSLLSALKKKRDSKAWLKGMPRSSALSFEETQGVCRVQGRSNS